MTVKNFLDTYQNSMYARKDINPLTGSPVARSVTPTEYGSSVPDWLQSKSSGAMDRYMQDKAKRTGNLAAKYTDMAAGQIATNDYGIPIDKSTDFNDFFNQNLSTVGQSGKNALATEEAKATWQRLQNQQEMAAGYTVNYTNQPTPGASGDNKGSQAVSIAMQSVQNNTPYQWGGNNLITGVDCSGLVQQVYGQLGIQLPRSTYEQAKAGKVVNDMSSLLPGDLIFYNTGANDPNGIGQFSHVAIYIGNGQVIDAPGRGKTVRVTSLNNSGSPARAVRPW